MHRASDARGCSLNATRLALPQQNVSARTVAALADAIEEVVGLRSWWRRGPGSGLTGKAQREGPGPGTCVSVGLRACWA